MREQQWHIELTIKKVSGFTFPIVVNSQACTFRDLKAKIQTEQGISANWQRLLIQTGAGRSQPNDDLQLRDFVQHGDVVHLALVLDARGTAAAAAGRAAAYAPCVY